MSELEEILENMTNGNWSIAIEQYKKLYIPVSDYMEFISGIPEDDLYNFALLGLYSKGKIND